MSVQEEISVDKMQIYAHMVCRPRSNASMCVFVPKCLIVHRKC